MIKQVSETFIPPSQDRYATGKGKNKRYADWPKDGLILEHIADNPMTFKTKRDLQDYCKKKGLSAGALS